MRFCERREFGSENGSVVQEQSCLSTNLVDFIGFRVKGSGVRVQGLGFRV